MTRHDDSAPGHSAEPSASERGFALPLALAVLVILAFVVASTTQRIFTAQVQTRLAVAEIERDSGGLIVENEILWRAVLEGLGQDLTPTASRDERNYRARAPDSSLDWRTDGVPFLWEGNYKDARARLDTPPPAALVMVQDTLGLLDLNMGDPKYIAFVATKLGVPRGQTDSAVRILQDYVAERRPMPERDDLVLMFPNRSGIIDPVEICALRVWRDIALCDRPESLRQIATGGYGQVANIRFTPPELARSLIGRAVPEDMIERELAWNAVQRTGGFYDGLLGVSNGGVRVEVTVLIRGNSLASRFEIDLREQEGEQPYAFKTMRVIPAETVLQLARSRDPDVASAYEQLPVPPLFR